MTSYADKCRDCGSIWIPCLCPPKPREKTLQERHDELKARCEQLEAALRVYADEGNWAFYDGNQVWCRTEDGAEFAANALAEIGSDPAQTTGDWLEDSLKKTQPLLDNLPPEKKEALRKDSEFRAAEIGNHPAQPTDDNPPGAGCDSRCEAGCNNGFVEEFPHYCLCACHGWETP